MFLLSLRSFSFQVSFRAATFNARSMALARLEARLKRAVKGRKRESHGGPAKAAHDEAGAELLLEGGLLASGLSEAALAWLSRGAAPKVVLASQAEPRWHCLGQVGDAILTVRFTERNGRVRIIGAGYCRKGKQIYETENKIR